MELINLEVLDKDIKHCKEMIKEIEDKEDISYLKELDYYKRLLIYMLVCKKIYLK